MKIIMTIRKRGSKNDARRDSMTIARENTKTSPLEGKGRGGARACVSERETVSKRTGSINRDSLNSV